MLKRDRQLRMQMHQFVDACLFAAAFWLAYVLRSDENIMDLLGLDPVSPFDQYVWMWLVLIPAAPLILEAQGFYNRPVFCLRRIMFWPLLKSCAITSLALIIALFLFRVEIARSVIILFGFTSFFLVVIKEELLRMSLRSRLAQQQYRRRILLVGVPEETARMRQDLHTHLRAEVEVAAELDLSRLPLKTLLETLHDQAVNGVIVSSKHSYFEQVESVIRACELEGVEVWLVADFFRTQISRTTFDDFYGRPVLVFSSTPESSWQSVAKQLMDVLIASVTILIISPLLAGIALAVKYTSPGPILFRQKRSGLNGRPFTIFKFRTMVTNAEQLKHELAAMNEMTGPVFKVTNDPRITPIGRFLRKYSLDELPQLFNIVRGEMSVVGPRPLPVDEVKQFNDLAHRRRLSVKPGLTCLWQVSGRNNVKDFQDWVRLDLEYIDNWSLWLDIKIIFRTVPVVLLGTGAK
jgi:exopolysaccharide biosynthesis polyprenyl glycosylphosphotransferase